MRSRAGMLSLGAIGDRSHAGRMIAIAEATGLARVTRIYKPCRTINDPRYCADVDSLLDCDAVLVLSPNDTHLQYLEALSQRFSGYLFCEKPPVASEAQLARLAKLELPKGRTFFDFNLRFGPVREAIDEAREGGLLGHLVACSAVCTHGLAFKESYPTSWRADVARHRLGVAETVAIHYLDLFAVLFGDPTEVAYYPSLRSGRGSADDTCRLLLRFPGGATGDVLASYAAPFRDELWVLGTEGVLTVRDDWLETRAPRATFDKLGQFTTPPLVRRVQLTAETAYEASLRGAMRYFLEHVRDARPLPQALFEQSLATCQHLFALTSHGD